MKKKVLIGLYYLMLRIRLKDCFDWSSYIKEFMKDSIVTIESISQLRKNGEIKRVVFVSGVFNILHPGHFRLLRFEIQRASINWDTVDIEQVSSRFVYNLNHEILKNKYDEIQKKFGENYELSEEIIRFLASEVTSSIREMVGALNRVLAYTKINTKSPSIYECKKILKDFITYNKKQINVESIQNIVATYFNLSIQEMLSARRSRSLARPRQIAMYLAKQFTTNSLPEIGRKFSNRDHTTVIHAVKKVNELISKDNEIRLSVGELKKRII